MTEKVGGIEFDVEVNADGAISASKKIVTQNEAIEDSFQDIDAASKRAGDNMSDSLNKGAKASGNFSRNLGMGAVQVGQFAGQIQGGQSALLAFSQQGADIGMLFGPTGMVLGGIVAVGAAVATMLAPAMMEGGDKTQDLTDKLKELRKTTELTTNEAAFLAQEEAKASKERKEKIKVLNEEIAELEAVAAGTSTMAKVTEAARNATSGLTKEIANALLPSLKEEREELVKNRAELDQLKRAQGELKTATAIDPEENKKAIAGYQERLAALKIAMEQESAIVINNLKYRQGVEEGIFSEQEAAIALRNENQIVNEKAAFANKLAMLEEQRSSILENDALTEDQRQQLQDEYKIREADALWTHQQKLTNIENQAADARMAIAQKEKQAKMNALSSTFSSLSSLMNTESKKLFEIGKAAAVAGAIVDGFAAVQKTMASVPYPFNIPLAAAQAVASAAQIQGIMKTKFGDKGSSQVYAGGQAATPTTGAGGQQEPQRQIVDVRVTGQGGGIVDMFNFEVANGAQPITTGG